MHLGRRGEYHRIGALDAFGQFAGVMRDAVLLGDLGGGVLIAADQGGDFDVGNALERIEMLLPERPLPCYADFHFISPNSSVSSRSFGLVIASEAKQSRYSGSGLLRRSAPRNDD